MQKIDLLKVLSGCLGEIEAKTGEEITGIQRVMKLYGVNANSFILSCVQKNGLQKQYFLKFNDLVRIENEVVSWDRIAAYLPTPKLEMHQKLEGTTAGWVLFEHLPGKLVTEEYLDMDYEADSSSLLNLEIEKERMLVHMYKSTVTKIGREEFQSLRVNDMFYGRLFGERFSQYYTDNPEGNISNYFDKRINLNGYDFSLSVAEEIERTKMALNNVTDDEFVAYLGHGDAHHGNMMLNEDKSLCFIDNEYAGNIPVNLELAKPYYIDSIGELFFHYHKTLRGYFRLGQVEQEDGKLFIKIDLVRPLGLRLEIAKIKLKMREDLIRAGGDPLALNHYLLISHMLSRNPNTYPEDVKWMFLPFVLILANFDPYDPDSIYKYF